MRKLVALACAGLTIAWAGRALAAIDASASKYYADEGAEVSFDTSDTTVNVFGTTGGKISVYEFAGAATFKPTGSGETCVINPTLQAAANLAIDLGQFEFQGETRTLELKGGVICGGTFTVTGATAVEIGASHGGACPPVDIPTVALNGATLTFVGGVNVFALPPKNAQDWSFAPNCALWLSGEDALRDLYEVDAEGRTVFNWSYGTQTQIDIMGSKTIRAGVVFRVPDGKTAYVYPTAPYQKAENDGHDFIDWFGRGGHSGNQVDCDFELCGETATLYVRLRALDFNGAVTGTGRLFLYGNRASGSTNRIKFNGPVNFDGSVSVDDASAHEYWFNNDSFTNGVTLAYNANATNSVIHFTKKDGVDTVPHFTSVKFPPAGKAFKDIASIKPENAVTIAIDDLVCDSNVDDATGVFAGCGGAKVLLGGVSSDKARLFVEGASSVEKNPDVAGAFCTRTDAEPMDGKTYLTCFTGNLDLNGYPETGNVTVYGDATLSGTVDAMPTVAADVSAASSVVLVDGGTGWDKDENISLWLDFSDLSTMTQVVVTADPPTMFQNDKTKILNGDDLGPKSLELKPFGLCPQPESFVDRRGGSGSLARVENRRMYKVGTNEYWSTVYMYVVTNDPNAAHTYLTGGPEGKNGGRRLEFRNTADRKAAAQIRNIRSVTLVFSAQYGGGAGILADDATPRIFGREKGLQSSILSNDTCDVWLNGVKVDPTNTCFTGGWDVITLQPKSAHDWVKISGIGWSQAYTGTGVDGGGQSYGEIIMNNGKLPTDAERVALESYLARKWNITNYNFMTPKVKLTGTGTVSATDGYEVGGDFAGTLALSKYAAVKLTGDASGVTVSGKGAVSADASAAIPKFDAGFAGTITLGPDALAVEVPADADPSVAVLDLRPATVKFSGEPKLKVTFPNGAPQPGLYTVLAAGGGLDAAWSYDLPDHTKIKDVTATSVILKVYNGLVIFFR